MRAYGFSTGALAPGDFERALDMLGEHATSAIELSALRAHELLALMHRLPALDLRRFAYISIHAPSRFEDLGEAEAARLLRPCIENGWSVVIHPDAIHDEACWAPFGELLCIENMDKRKQVGRSAHELGPIFDRLPRASLCLDLGHARQVDPSLIVARGIVRAYGSRLRQLHLSEVDVQCRHARLSMATVFGLRALVAEIATVPVILEGRVQAEQMAGELRMARLALEPRHEDARAM